MNGDGGRTCTEKVRVSPCAVSRGGYGADPGTCKSGHRAPEPVATILVLASRVLAPPGMPGVSASCRSGVYSSTQTGRLSMLWLANPSRGGVAVGIRGVPCGRQPHPLLLVIALVVFLNQLQQRTRTRPLTKLIRKTTSAMTSSRWMRLPATMEHPESQQPRHTRRIASQSMEVSLSGWTNTPPERQLAETPRHSPGAPAPRLARNQYSATGSGAL